MSREGKEVARGVQTNSRPQQRQRTIRFLPQLNAILGHRPSTQPKIVIESNSIVEQEETEGKHF